ncbi:nuclear transport factor 2 family protein [Nocardioides zeae]|uniref:Nuclear transport factor 2 family protein n=1 Tax=Nocardioides zeae TaxID=1457234 RepID=A0A6P0HK70_9ACTN|nr:nuclear transport factor 2 family protein [Nocardioides zeae]NEN79109.1 nuclear transport factor 2 family protein [Nocardioides zeae]
MSTPAERPATVARWHELVAHRDAADVDARLHDLLAPAAVFRSPAVHQPQEGRELTAAYLRAALVVLGPELRYEREWWDERSAVLEFATVVGGREVHGIDMLTWGDDGRIVDFTVMVRPLRGLEALVELMGAELRRGR